MKGTLYMLCFDRPLGDPARPRMSARHYVGWFLRPSRITHHANGTSGVPIVYAFYQRGIPFVVVRTRPGTKADERRIKDNGNHAKYCPRCSPKPWNGVWVI